MTGEETAIIKAFDTWNEGPLAAFTDEELRAELQRRQAVRVAAEAERRQRDAKHTCPHCGLPDGWHSFSCPSDTD